MNKPRMAHSGYIYETPGKIKYLYVFGGINSQSNTTHQSIERLNISVEDSQWEMVDLKFETKDVLASNFLVFESFDKSTHPKFMLLGGKFSTKDSPIEQSMEVEIVEEEEEKSVQAVIRNVNFFAQPESFNSRVACPYNFYSMNNAYYAISDSGTAFEIKKNPEHDDILEQLQHL
jgi:hypothetical protein